MLKFINKLTGTETWVAENRADEYKAAGHTPAARPTGEEKPAKKGKKKE